MISDARAKSAAQVAWTMVEPDNTFAPPAALQSILAIARLESAYGDIKKQETNNWGAVQCTHAPPAIPGECIALTDSHPSGEKYEWCYRSFPTPEDGAIFLLKTLKRMGCIPELIAGNVTALARKMYFAGYYGGNSKWGKKGIANKDQDPKHIEKVVKDYSGGLYQNGKAIAKNLNEPLALTESASSGGGASGGFGIAEGAILGGIALFILTRVLMAKR